MPDLLIWTLVLAAALVVLLKGADYFVENAAALARNLGVPDFLVGVTLVALGTSLPELAASLFSVLSGAREFVAGTVVGSNVANITFILGAAALAFRGVAVSPSLLRMDLPVLILSALVLSAMLMDGGVGRWEGLLLLGMYVLYLAYALSEQNRSAVEKIGEFRPIILLWLALSGAGVYLGAEYTVKAVIKITEMLGLKDTSLLALTVVAIGSSLPELVVTLTAAKKSYHDLSVGNVVGSNICNSFLVMGAPAVIAPLPVSPLVMNAGVPLMIVASLALFFFGRTGAVGRVAGLFLLAVFALFIGKSLGVM